MDLCEKCGTELNEQGICPNCGVEEAANETVNEVVEEAANEAEEVVEEVEQKAEEAAESKPAMPDKGLLTRIIAAIVALAVIIGCFALTGRSYKKVAKDYMNAVLNGQPKKIAKLLPKDVVDLYTEVMYDGDKEKFYDSINDMSYLSKEIEEKDIKPSKVKVKIKDVEDLGDNELKSAKLAFHSKKIKKGKKVTLEVTLPGEDNAREYTVTTVKKGRKWYYFG